jgi:hypothetical protein
MRPFFITTILFFLSFVLINTNEAQSTGYLKIKVNQTATVYLDGKNLGDIDPYEEKLLEVKIGNHQLKVIKEGYKTHFEDITISTPNEILERRINLLRPENFKVDKDVSGSNVSVEYGELTVITKLSGSLVAAKVYVDDKFADNAPIKLSKLFVGQHTISVTYNSFSKTKTVNIQKDKSDVLEIELYTYSVVNFISPQTGITGTIDLNEEISIPSNKELSLGEHKLRFSKEGLIPAEKTIYVDGQSNYLINVNLSVTLPYIDPVEVNRDYKKPYTKSDFMKPETRQVSNFGDVMLGGLICGTIFGGISALISAPEKKLENFLWCEGIFCGIALIGGLVFPDTKAVPNKENIDYNNSEVPKIVSEKNLVIESYNQDTERLVKEKQISKYQEDAIIVTKLDN